MHYNFMRGWGGGGEGKKKAYEKERSVSGSADTHQLQMCAYSEVS